MVCQVRFIARTVRTYCSSYSTYVYCVSDSTCHGGSILTFKSPFYWGFTHHLHQIEWRGGACQNACIPSFASWQLSICIRFCGGSAVVRCFGWRNRPHSVDRHTSLQLVQSSTFLRAVIRTSDIVKSSFGELVSSSTVDKYHRIGKRSTNCNCHLAIHSLNQQMCVAVHIVLGYFV